MEKERFRNIMKINGFIYGGKHYIRDDGIDIENKGGEYILAYQDGSTIFQENKNNLIGYLVLRGIINRLF